MKNSFQGDCYRVVHCIGALKTLGEALEKVTPVKRRKSMMISIQLQIERLASGKRSSDLCVRKEGLLPPFNGKPAKNFWAIKKIPIRGYYWESERHDMTIFISHYIYKNFNKLDDSDIHKVKNNWERIERGCDEC